jgi:Icc-related predicted phosphoesterase
MRVIFLTDIHDEFEAAERILQRVRADLYLLAGDLLYRVFPTNRTAWDFMETASSLSGLKQGRPPGETLTEVALSLKAMGKKTPHYGLATHYLRLCHQARSRMLSSYRKLGDILDKYPNSVIRVLPGNYDMDLTQTPLSARNLHLQFLDLGGVRVAGYGGARLITPGVPDHLQVQFREERTPEGLYSEALDFFRSVRPHLLVVHQPPYGLMDELQGQGPIGSLGIRQYLDEEAPMAVLCGHMHHRWGARRLGKTWCLNPSNFGRVQEVSGVRRGGYFLDLGLGSHGVSWAMIRRLVGERIVDVVHYQPRGGAVRQVILDEGHFKAMGGRVSGPKHIRPFRQLQVVRSFFLRQETPQSRALVRELRAVYRSLERKAVHVAFDLLGSLSLGMAGEGSDMDLVIYLRGLQCQEDEQDVCRVPEPLSRVLEAIEKRGIRAEICDSIDLERVERAIERQDREDTQLQRFVFYRAVCRPVNLRLIKEVENRLFGKERFRRSLEKKLQEHLRILVSSGRQLDSWGKYMERARESSVEIPPRIHKAIMEYLGR